MAFNRWADADLDAANPTNEHPGNSGRTVVTWICGGVHGIDGAGICDCLGRIEPADACYLAPFVLAVLLGYSYMKRFTRWSHLVLGLALGLAPSAAWIAVRGSLDPRIVVLTAAVMLWVGGFDVLYACQDFEHDRQAGLHSIPQAMGVPAAFMVARGMHAAMLGLLIWFGYLFNFGIAGWLGVAAAGLLLAYEHSIVSPRDMRRLNAAFFTMNGVIAMVFLLFVAADIWLRR